jgi:hypothetical protein
LRDDTHTFCSAHLGEHLPRAARHAFDQGERREQAGHAKDHAEHREKAAELVRKNLAQAGAEAVPKIHDVPFAAGCLS